MTTDVSAALATLQLHPEDSQALKALAAVHPGNGAGIDADVLSQALSDARRFHRERGDYELVIDMCAVTFVDMSTLNRIVRAMKEVYRHNGHLVVACADRHVLRAIELAGLRHAVRVYDTREEAIAHVADRADA